MTDIPFSLRRTQGFTLVEISIVLVIVGLVVGGAVGGYVLIRAAELRGVITQQRAFEAAVQTFRLKYRALPGDMVTATDIWGAADANPANCPTAAAFGTCNGDGDGRIASRNAGSPQWYEMYRFWQQLSMAGLIVGEYTGLAGASRFHHVPGVNSPLAKVHGGTWSVYYTYINGLPGGPEYLVQTYYEDNTMYFGMAGPPVGFRGTAEEPLITPSDAFQIDSKMDDGRPGSGEVIGPAAASPLSPNCTTTSSAITALYRTTFANAACNLLFRTGF